MDFYSTQISNLVDQLSHLPGIGAKSAQRLAFHILNMPQDQVAGLSNAMLSAKKMCVIVRNAVHIRMMNFVRSVRIQREIISRSWS